jgi:ABC-2 type transport system permease protein
MIAVAGCGLTAVCTTMIELWRQRPGKRSEFRRNRGSSVLVPLIEVFVGLLIGASVAMLIVAVATRYWFVGPFAAAPLVIALLVVWAAKPRQADLTAVVQA